MSDLRAELAGRPATATPYTILCPPGWQRIPPSDLVEGAAVDRALATIKSTGRADLMLQYRGILSRLRTALRESKAFDAYLAPITEDGPIPAMMVVSPFVLPGGITWDQALLRLSKGAQVEDADFTETPMWFWRRDEAVPESDGQFVASASSYIVPVPDEGPAGRALHFRFTVLAPPGDTAPDGLHALTAIGDLMMSTMRWRVPRAAG